MTFKTKRVGDVIDEIAMGPFGSNIKVDCFVPSGVPVLNGSNLTGFSLTEDTFNYVTPEKAASLKRAVASRGDIVITHRGTLGQIVYIPADSKHEKYVISQSQFRVRCKESAMLPEFMVYFFHSREGRHRLLSNSSQVGVPALARPSSTFQELEMPVPTITEQRLIVSTLSALDSRIALNKKINHHLEQLAQAIFKSWFVDFEPFSNGDFIESELGEIPTGWRVGSLSELITVKYGKDHKKLADGTIPVFGSGGVMRFADTALYNDESVLIPRKGTLNNVIYVNQPFWSVDTMFYTEMRRPNLAKFIYFFVRSKDLALMNAGSAVPSMTTEILNSLPVVVPPDSELARYEELVGAQFKQIQANQAEIDKLATIRDTLLSRLMSRKLSDINL